MRISGLYRGEVTAVATSQVAIRIVRLNPNRDFWAEQLPDTLAVGDRVLVGFAEGRPDAAEVMRRTL